MKTRIILSGNGNSCYENIRKKNLGEDFYLMTRSYRTRSEIINMNYLQNHDFNRTNLLDD